MNGPRAQGYGREWRADVALLALYLAASLPLHLWGIWGGPLAGLNYGSTGWASFSAYAVGGPVVAYLLWTGNPRARLAAYVFFTFDVLRSIRLAHWVPMAVGVAWVLYLQTPAMRAVYPSMWSRRRALWDRWGRKGQG